MQQQCRCGRMLCNPCPAASSPISMCLYRSFHFWPSQKLCPMTQWGLSHPQSLLCIRLSFIKDQVQAEVCWCFTGLLLVAHVLGLPSPNPPNTCIPIVGFIRVSAMSTPPLHNHCALCTYTKLVKSSYMYM